MRSRERRIGMMRGMGSLLPMFKRIAYYLEAANYWTVVSHVAPAYGTDTFDEYLVNCGTAATTPAPSWTG